MYRPNGLAFFICTLALWGAFALHPTSVTATPSDEISRAVSAGGAANIESASPAQLVRALTAVLVHVPEKRFAEYVTSAIKLRLDLAPQIAAAALRAHRRSPKDFGEACDWVDPIIRAAIAAAPRAKDAIVRAALEVEPFSRECITAAAGVTDFELAFNRTRGIDAGNINSTSIGTINPANISAVGNQVSPNQILITLCNGGQTLLLPRADADQYLRDNPGASRGSCQ